MPQIMENFPRRLKYLLPKAAICLIFLGLSVVTSCAQLGTPPIILVQPLGISVPIGGTVILTTTALSTTSMTFNWSLNGKKIDKKNKNTTVVNVVIPLVGTISTLTVSDVDAGGAGTYTVQIVNGVGSVTSAKAVVLLTAIPLAITTQPSSQLSLSGKNVSFTVAATGTAPLIYQWYFNGTPVVGPAGQNTTLALNNVGTNNAGSYAVVVKDNSGSVTSSIVSLTVYIAPSIAPPQEPQNVTVTQGQDTSFSVVATGTAPMAYQWYLSSGLLAGDTNSTLALTNVQPNQAGSYKVVITNLVGSITSQAATLTVNSPPAITTQPSSQLSLPGKNVSFAITASGTMPLTYQWYFNGTPVVGPAGQNTTLALNNVGTNNAGSYAVVVKDNSGSVTSSIVTLAVVSSMNYPVSECSMTPAGFQIQLTNVTSSCVIYASSNLVDWIPITTNNPISGIVTYTDVSATSLPLRYYKAKTE